MRPLEEHRKMASQIAGSFNDDTDRLENAAIKRERDAAVRDRDELRTALRRAESVQRCIFSGCVATWKHWHSGFPGGYDDPADPKGPPIEFLSADPEPDAVRDYNGAALHREDGASRA